MNGLKHFNIIVFRSYVKKAVVGFIKNESKEYLI